MKKSVYSIILSEDVVHEIDRLAYENGPIVTANASFGEATSFPFTSTFRVTLERATVVWDGRGQVMLYPTAGEARALVYDQTDHMAEESRYFLEVVRGEHANEKNPPESAMATIALIERLHESAARNGENIPVKKENENG